MQILLPRVWALRFAATMYGLMLAGTALAMDIGGVKLADTARIGADNLVLNGAGIRKRVVISVYVGALYLPEKKTAATEAVNAPGPKRLHLQMLREISAQQLVDAMKDGVKNNTPQTELDKMTADLNEFYGLAGSVGALKAGDIVTIDYAPNGGLTMALNGKAAGKPIANAELYKAVMRIFIGEKPVDDGLKKGMLGG